MANRYTFSRQFAVRILEFPQDKGPGMPICKFSVVAACILWLSLGGILAQKFRVDDPIRVDPDKVLSIGQPTNRPMSKTIDLFQKTFTKPTGGSLAAQNINTVGEVPDSSWFTNRMSRRVMTIAEVVQGPNKGTGPDFSKPATVLSVKTEGTTPGLTIRDAQGDLYILKFDTMHWPGMATSAEVIGTKFFHAFGYHTPENYLVDWKPEYELDREAVVLWDFGLEEKLTPRFIRNALENVPQQSDGTYRVVASKLLPGKPLGPFDFQGQRSDDPNDIYLHEDRRELRAYAVFCAWLNHNDSDSVNTLDMYHTDDGGISYVLHYLIDFGTIMGSGATHPHARRIGNEYYIEFEPALKAGLTLGIWERPWHHIELQTFPAIGRWEGEYFQAESWKPDYPNPAFDKMQPQDALWATRSMMRFDDEMVKAIVKTGRIQDPEAESYLVSTIIQRRDKTVRYHLAQINPVDQFRLSGERLRFTNLGVEANLANDCTYEYSWFKFDNQAEALEAVELSQTSTHPNIVIPDYRSDYLMVRISSLEAGYPKWKSEVDVYLRSMSGGGREVVGVERMTPQE
jgi:hypothetical protein